MIEPSARTWKVGTLGELACCRTPACHAGGRGFESGRSRQISFASVRLHRYGAIGGRRSKTSSGSREVTNTDDFRYQPIAEPEELGDGGRVRWVSGRPGEAPAYAGTDFIIARDGRIAALYLFFDKRTSRYLSCSRSERSRTLKHLGKTRLQRTPCNQNRSVPISSEYP